MRPETVGAYAPSLDHCADDLWSTQLNGDLAALVDSRLD
jgi:hypothetical protein